MTALNLWIDDIREPPDETWEWVSTSAEAIEVLDFFMTPSMVNFERNSISFDHDLGKEDTTRPVVLWMIENECTFNHYNVHSANPVGREWLAGMIEKYLM